MTDAKKPLSVAKANELASLRVHCPDLCNPEPEGGR
jgi:hypothetical protein